MSCDPTWTAHVLHQLGRLGPRLHSWNLSDEQHARHAHTAAQLISALAHAILPHDGIDRPQCTVNEALFRARRYVALARVLSLRSKTKDLLDSADSEAAERHLRAWARSLDAALEYVESHVERITGAWLRLQDTPVQQVQLKEALCELSDLGADRLVDSELRDCAIGLSSCGIGADCNELLMALDCSLTEAALVARDPTARFPRH